VRLHHYAVGGADRSRVGIGAPPIHAAAGGQLAVRVIERRDALDHREQRMDLFVGEEQSHRRLETPRHAASVRLRLDDSQRRGRGEHCSGFGAISKGHGRAYILSPVTRTVPVPVVPAEASSTTSGAFPLTRVAVA